MALFLGPHPSVTRIVLELAMFFTVNRFFRHPVRLSHFLMATLLFSVVTSTPGVLDLGGTGVGKGTMASYPDLAQVLQLQAGVGSLLDPSAAASLTLDITDSIMAVRDLRIRAQHSQLACKEELISKLEDFVKGAEEASVSLTDLSVHVGGTVESAVQVHKVFLRNLRCVEAQASMSQVSTVRYILVSLGLMHPPVLNEQALLDAFNKEGMEVAEEKACVLSSLLMYFGGNRGKLNSLIFQARILDGFVIYRERAQGHVQASLNQLRQLQGSLKGLKNRLTDGKVTVELAGADIPAIEDQIASLQKGVEELSGYTQAYVENQKEVYRGFTVKLLREREKGGLIGGEAVGGGTEGLAEGGEN
ncbi:hypothetical protein BOTBODRAFT_182158 [Botryobasidium botryosum FD-172 SS1]|uniref:Uncharacterized protein n=1 Tax=Botryobasidium botryosum (strain FD-172 SS1) TaxID=930990 RepID=A0A067M2S3_BOTB1|nr:hypothetical protein BOTBODRAFT_182158 [Botryobasidium botryosum FD-172 SS1]